MNSDLLTLDPVSTLLGRVRAELSSDFSSDRPIRLSRAPGRLDVMGGIAEYTGSLVCGMALDRAVGVALQPRADRQIQVFSFNQLDAHKPFTLRIPLEGIARSSGETLRRELEEPGRKWAAPVIGCLSVLHERKRIDLADPRHLGFNLALYNNVPASAGLGSSAAAEVATMMNLIDHFSFDRDSLTGLDIAEMCQAAENQIVGRACGIVGHVTSCLGEAGTLLRMVCQPHELKPSLRLPDGVRVIGIDSGVRREGASDQYALTRCATFMGHRIILDTMRRMGAAASRELTSDPMGGYLANLDPDDYKRLFRPQLPETMRGEAFLDRYGTTIDSVSRVDPAAAYLVQHAVDHHVLEARRVRRFVEFLEQASAPVPGSRPRGGMLDRAGHLMYASHLSYSNDAMLGTPECDTLVDLVRQRESAGLYGARLTAGGAGGTVAVLCNEGERAKESVTGLLTEYERQIGIRPKILSGIGRGAWHVGSAMVPPTGEVGV